MSNSDYIFKDLFSLYVFQSLPFKFCAFFLPDNNVDQQENKRRIIVLQFPDMIYLLKMNTILCYLPSGTAKAAAHVSRSLPHA